MASTERPIAGAGETVIDQAGWHAAAHRIASPNFDSRPEGAAIDLLVIHYISLPPGRMSGDAILNLFTNRLDCTAHPYFDALRAMRVSAHFLIRRRGELIQFVSCNDRAWHAGASSFMGREPCNDFSIGIELEGDEHRDFTRAQYRVLARLAAGLASRYPIRFVAGHSDIAPGRKFDPGPHFDWDRLGQSLAFMGVMRPFPPRGRAIT